MWVFICLIFLVCAIIASNVQRTEANKHGWLHGRAKGGDYGTVIFVGLIGAFVISPLLGWIVLFCIIAGLVLSS